MAEANHQRVAEAITGMWRTRVVFEATQAGMFDAMGEKGVEADALAQMLGLHAPTVLRVLRALAVLELVDQTGATSFRLNPNGRLLRSGEADSLRSMALMWGGRLWGQFEGLGGTLRTGVPARGNGDFAGLNADPVQSDVFNRAMAEQTRPIAAALVEKLDLGASQRVLDVGGGYGAVLATVLEAHSALTGAVYDLEAISAGARTYLSESSASERAQFISGSFFESVPTGFDTIFLKYILHDWPDEDCRTILHACRAAMEPGDRFILLERILPERIAGMADEAVVRADLVMLPISGKERTLAEFDAMLGEAGFEIGAVTDLYNGCSAIDCLAR